VTALYIVILGNIPFVGYATTIDSFVLVMLGMLAGIILVQVVYLLLFNHVYHSEDKQGQGGDADRGEAHPVLRPSSSPERSLPFRYLMNMCCSSSLADEEGDMYSAAPSGLFTPPPHKKKKKKKKKSAWLLWFSPESSQLLGEVCVAAMVLEHQQKLKKKWKQKQQEDTGFDLPASTSGSNSNGNIGGDFAESSHRGATTKDTPVVGSVVVDPTREKEIKKPIATFAMLGIEYCGRVFLIPFVLFYTNVLMLDRSMKDLGLLFVVSIRQSYQKM
jgi:hypothetical protein